MHQTPAIAGFLGGAPTEDVTAATFIRADHPLMEVETGPQMACAALETSSTAEAMAAIADRLARRLMAAEDLSAD